MRSPSDGICPITAKQIRAINSVQHLISKKPYNVDVYPRPIAEGNSEGLPANPAHAQIEVDPEFENKSRFIKLKDALCRLADENGWVIEPTA